MNYSLKSLDEIIDFWIRKKYNQALNKTYVSSFIKMLMSLSHKMYSPEYSRKKYVAFAQLVYHHYSLGEFEKVRTLFLNDNKICGLLTEEEKINAIEGEDITYKSDSKIKAGKNKNLKVWFDYLPAEDHATVSHPAVFNVFRLLYPKAK